VYRSITIGALATATALSGLAASASASTLKGTVVHDSKHAHSFVIADARGHLTAIHAARRPAVGRSVTVTARKLRNGTFAASRVRTGHAVKRARISGLVTFADRGTGAFVVSTRGASLVVHRRSPRLRAAAAADTLPAPGTHVSIDASLDEQGDIQAESVHNDGQNHDNADLEGVTLSIDAAARTLTISADDNDEISGGTILVHLPATFDLTLFHVGTVVQLVATPNADGSYTAVGISADGDSQEADGEHGQQGDDQESEAPHGAGKQGDTHGHDGSGAAGDHQSGGDGGSKQSRD
jgi:hypothetical protein